MLPCSMHIQDAVCLPFIVSMRAFKIWIIKTPPAYSVPHGMVFMKSSLPVWPFLLYVVSAVHSTACCLACLASIPEHQQGFSMQCQLQKACCWQVFVHPSPFLPTLLPYPLQMQISHDIEKSESIWTINIIVPWCIWKISNLVYKREMSDSILG